MKPVRIKKIEVTSLAVIMAVMYGAIGFLLGLFMMMFGGALSAVMEESGSPGMGAFGAMGMFIFPFIYGFIGFIVGALMAILFNLCAKFMGGLTIWTDDDE